MKLFLIQDFSDSYIPSVILGDNNPLFQNLECMRQLSCSALRNIRVSYMDNIFSSVRCIQFMLLRVCNTVSFHFSVYVVLPSLLPGPSLLPRNMPRLRRACRH